MRVFISWRGSDRELKNRIVDRLREALEPEGDEVWESDGGVISEFSSECLVALRESQIFIIIVSDECLKPSYVQNELIEAHDQYMKGKLNMLMFKTTDKPLPLNMSMHLNHISDAYNEYRAKADIEGGIKSLIEKVKRQLKLRKEGKAEKPYEVDKPIIEGTSFPTDEYVVENSRSEIVSEIEKAYELSNTVIVTGIDGYGRKTSVGEYIKVHEGDYSSIIYLESFAGTLSELIAYGISFSNVNDNAMNANTMEDIISLKLKYLEKLDSDVLLIVPSLRITEKDERVLGRIRKELRMRFFLVAEEISSKLFKQLDDLPSYTVIVSRMSDKNLRELFYHYYPEIDDDERDDFNSYIDRLFVGVDGHTLTVKVVAETLDRDGADRDEAVELLENSIENGCGELEDRINQTLSSLFKFNLFDENQLKMLSIASLICTVPIQYQMFKELVSSMMPWSGVVYKSLVDIHWLDETKDGSSKYVSMKRLFARCCQSNSILSINDTAKLFCKVYDEVFYKLFTASKNYFNYIKIMINICSVTGWKSVNEIATAFLQYTEKSEFDKEVIERLDSLYMSALSISNSFNDKELTEEFNDVLSNLVDSLKSILIVDKTRNDFFSMLDLIIEGSGYKQLFKDIQEKDDYAFDYFSRFNTNVTLLANLFKSSRIKGDRLEELFVDLLSMQEDDDYGFDLLSDGILNVVMAFTLEQFSSDNYKLLVITRAYVNAMERTDSKYTGQEIKILSSFLYAMTLLTEEDEEIKNKFVLLILICNEERGNDFFNSSSDYYEIVNNNILIYANYLVKREKIDELEELYNFYIDKIGFDLRSLPFFIDFVEKIFNLYISENMAEEGFIFLQDNITKYIEPNIGTLDSSKEDVFLQYEGLKEVMRVHDSDDTSSDDLEAPQDYYSRIKDYRNLKNYESIADSAFAFDFTDLSQDELIREFTSLKELVKMRNVSWQKIAPKVFGLVSEAGYRVLGYRHHKVQLIGGAVIFDDNIAEIRNGEGKTYTIILAAFLHYIYGHKVIILDESPYLTKRNYSWMRGVFEYLGVSVAFSITKGYPENEWDVLYQSAYSALVGELFNEMNYTEAPIHHEALIVDEADCLMYSDCYESHDVRGGKSYDSRALIDYIFNKLETAIKSNPYLYFKVEKDHIEYYEYFYEFINELKDIVVEMFSPPGFVANKIQEICKAYVSVFFLFSNGKHYYIKNEKPLMEHKASGLSCSFIWYYDFFISKKENLDKHIEEIDYSISEIVDSISMIEYIRRFSHISGTTATASSIEKMLKDNYGTSVYSIPTNKPVLRNVYSPFIYPTKEGKKHELLDFISKKKESGQPILVVTGSLEESKSIYDYFSTNGVVSVLLNAENEEKEEEILSEVGLLGRITITTALANRGVDIQLGGNAEQYVKAQFIQSGVDPEILNRAVFGLEQSDELITLREQFYKRVKIRKAETAPIKKKIEELGGLCVIGTECFDDIRTEVQLEGRCARQGSPGECYSFYSIQDDRLSVINIFPNLFNSLDENEHIDSKFVNNSIRRFRESRLNKTAKFQSLHYLNSAKERIKKRILDIKANLLEEPSCIWKEMVPYIDERIYRFIKDDVKCSLKKNDLTKKSSLIVASLERNIGRIYKIDSYSMSRITQLFTQLIDKLDNLFFLNNLKEEKREAILEEQMETAFKNAFWQIFCKMFYVRACCIAAHKWRLGRNREELIPNLIYNSNLAFDEVIKAEKESGATMVDAAVTAVKLVYGMNLTGNNIYEIRDCVDVYISQIKERTEKRLYELASNNVEEEIVDKIERLMPNNLSISYISISEGNSSYDKYYDEVSLAYLEYMTKLLREFWSSTFNYTYD